MRAFGVCLSLLHVLTFLFWTGPHLGLHGLEGSIRYFYHAHGATTCWPNASLCGWLFNLGALKTILLLDFYLLVAVLTTFNFIKSKRLSFAYAGLIFLFILKFGLIFTNTVLMPNYHYIVLLINIVYLFLPRKKDLIPLTLVACYVSAGWLKINAEWLSGAALLEPVPAYVPKALLQTLLVAAIFFELIASWGLLAKRSFLRWGAYGLVVAFHLLSWPQVGFFYPLIMLTLTLIFPMLWLTDSGTHGLNRAFFRGHLPKLHYAFLGLLAFAQIYPRLLPGDVALTGQARFLMLNMFDATPLCQAAIRLRYENGRSVVVADHPQLEPVRTRCDSLKYYNLASQLCAKGQTHPGFLDVDMTVRLKRTTDPKFTTTFHLEQFCTRHVAYNFLSNNLWITQ